MSVPALYVYSISREKYQGGGEEWETIENALTDSTYTMAVSRRHVEKICGFRRLEEVCDAIEWAKTIDFGIPMRMIWYIERRTLSGTRYTLQAAIHVRQSMMFYYFILFSTFFLILYVYYFCGDAEGTHQCEILLDIITHYYLLKFDLCIHSYFFLFSTSLRTHYIWFFCLVLFFF